MTPKHSTMLVVNPCNDGRALLCLEDGRSTGRVRQTHCRRTASIWATLPLILGVWMATVSPVSGLEIMAWVPPYAVDICQSAVQADFGAYDARDGLTRVGLQFWVPQTDGTIKYATHEQYIPSDTDVIWWRNWCHANKIKVLLTIYNNTGKWDWTLARSAFGSNRAKFVSALVAEMDGLGLDGIDIDLEGTGRLDSDRAAFASFINELSVQVKARGKILTVDSFHYIWNAPNQNWWPDWLGKVDQIHTMGYDDLYEGGSGYHKYSFQQNAGTSAGFPASAILMGFPSWVDSWGVTSGSGTDTIVHLHEVHYKLAKPAGIAIWDLQLAGDTWRSSAVWEEIAMLKALGGNGSDPQTPTANDQSVTTEAGQSVTFNLAGSDPNGDKLSYSIVSGPSAGQLSTTVGGTCTYTPKSGFIGKDGFTFTASDGTHTSAPATVSISVSGLIKVTDPWKLLDVGKVGMTGSGLCDPGLGEFDLCGEGAGLTGTADGFLYMYQWMSSDGEIRAHLTDVSNGAPAGAVAGVMIRETTAAGSAHHFIGRRNDGVFVWIRRNATGRSTSLATGGTAGLPCWVRLVRTGTTITAYQSSDGAAWTRINNAKISMATQVTAGLAVSSSLPGSLFGAAFDGVQLVP
jgi:hypothetical protein